MKKVIAIIGPTGTGKTISSLLLAKTLNTEIISSDSMQIYKYMDIGTAKPSYEERQFVKHHMIDIVNPWEFFSTGEYIKKIKPIIDNIHKKNRMPIIVGGTGLYFKAMTRGIFEGPSADWKLREELKAMEAKEEGLLYSYLKKIDPDSAKRIAPNDSRRIIRAIEVFLKEHKPISELQKTFTKPLQYDFLKIGLIRDRKELYKIIDERVDKMMAQGLLEEVKNVVSMIQQQTPNYLPYNLPALQAIGYKELISYLKGEITLEGAVALIKKRSRNYAKRQLTWFKKEDNIKWIDLSGLFEPKKILDKIFRSLKDQGIILSNDF